MSTTRFSSLLLILALVVAFMILAQRFLIPLAVAVAVWFLVNAIADALGKIPLIGRRIPAFIRRALASTFILAFLWLSVEIIMGSVNEMIALAPAYQARLMMLSAQMMEWIGPEKLPKFADYMQAIDLQPVFAEVGGLISSFAGDFFLVILYTIFLLVEQGTFTSKWKATFLTKESLETSTRTLERVSKSVREFALLKTATNLAVALLSLIVLALVGQDFALFWAFLIFLLNYIPTFGSFAAVGMPSLFAMLQFEGMTGPVAVFAGISVAHGVVGYLIEPRLLGQRLNMSPLVILISLSLWGMIWGVIGMILAVPIMVTLMIVLAAFPYTRPVAVWLSSNGHVGEEPVDAA